MTLASLCDEEPQLYKAPALSPGGRPDVGSACRVPGQSLLVGQGAEWKTRLIHQTSCLQTFKSVRTCETNFKV